MAPSKVRTESCICDTHGEYKSTILLAPGGGEIASPCFKCFEDLDRKRIAAELAQNRKEREDRAWKEKLRRAAIPERFSDRRLTTYVASCQKSQRALSVASAYAENFDDAMKTGSSLIFCGEVGTGKTHLAIGIAHEIMQSGKQAVFTSVMRAVRSVKETYSRNSEISEADAIESLVTPDLLILDEVGVQFGSDTEKLILFEIINGRYESMRPTIVISNLAAGALESFLGARAFDRLREGGGKLVVFDWASYRSKA